MSLVFSDTATKKGLVQEYERELGFDYGDVSGSSTRLAEFVASVNSALDDFIALAIMSDGRWQFDDSNQTDYPIISTNLIAGQRDYSFTTDDSGNLVLDIFRVLIATPSGAFVDLQSVDVESQSSAPVSGNASGVLYSGGTDGFVNGQNVQGTPTRYDKQANGIFVDPIPSYNAVSGLKVYVNREGSYFVATDTTKKPGVPGIFHRYFVIKAAYRYASRNSMPIAGGRLKNGAFTGLLMEINNMEDSIEAYFSRRSKDEKPNLSAGRHSNR